MKLIKHPTKYIKYTKSKNPYKILGIKYSATEAQIEKAYHKQCIKHHPDHGGDPEYFKKIQAAYESIKTGNAPPQDAISIAASIIKNALVKAVKDTHTTPEKEAKKEIEQFIRNSEIEIDSAKRQVAKAKKLLETYIKYNTGPATKQVISLMKEDLRASEKTIRNNERTLERHKKAYDIIKEMKWEPANPFYYNYRSDEISKINRNSNKWL